MMLSPRKRISPESLATLPEIWPMSVVLPAPFGPMSACTSPAATSRSTLSTATTPPKRLQTLLSCSTLSLHQSGNSLRRQQHDGEEDDAYRELPMQRVVAEERAAREPLLEREQHHGADGTAPEASDAAEDHHDHQRARLHPVQ